MPKDPQILKAAVDAKLRGVKRPPNELAPMIGFDHPYVVPGSREFFVPLNHDMGLDNPTSEELEQADRDLRKWLKGLQQKYPNNHFHAYKFEPLFKALSGEVTDEFIAEIRGRKEVNHIAPNRCLVLPAVKGQHNLVEKHMQLRAEYEKERTIKEKEKIETKMKEKEKIDENIGSGQYKVID